MPGGLVVLVLIVLITVPYLKAEELVSEDCWESCLQESGAYQAEYFDLYKLIQDARLARVASGANGTALLLDANIADETGLTDATADATFDFTKKISQLMVMTTPTLTTNNPFFTTLFDNSRSWYCFNWQCLGRCDAYDLLESAASTGRSAIRSRLEDGCLTASHMFDMDGDNIGADYSCLQYSFNQMVLAVVNGPFETAQSLADAGGGDSPPGSCAEDEELTEEELAILNKNGLLDDIMSELDDETDLIMNPESDFKSYCSHYFSDNRFIVGTHRAIQDDLDHWSGGERSSYMLPNTADMMAAVDQLMTCMYSTCCPSSGAGSDGDPAECRQTDGLGALESFTP